MENTQNINILKKFQDGDFSEAINLWAHELKKDALSESIHQSIANAKNHLEKIPEKDTSKSLFSNKLSNLQAFFNINLTGKFRQSSEEKNIDSPISGMKESPDGDIVISDDFNHRVQIYDSQYHLKFSFGQKGNKPGEFYYPKGIDIDPGGNMYIADCWNHRIQKFTREGKFILAFGSYGSSPSQFNEPVSIAIHNENRLFVVDRCNHRIQCFDVKGQYQGSIGHRGRVIEENLAELFETPPAKFSLPSFEFPSDIALDSKKNVYVVDSHNHRILKFDLRGNFLLSFGRQGKEQGEFLYPQFIAIDQLNNVFISDLNNNRIQLFSPVGEHYFSFSGKESKENVESPTVLAFGKNHTLFSGFAFNSKVLTFCYQPISPKERYCLKEDFSKSSAHSLFLAGNLFQTEQNTPEAIIKYEEAISIICANGEHIIPSLPLCYLHSTQKTEKQGSLSHLLNFYEKKLSRQSESIWEIYVNRKNIAEKIIDPTLDSEKFILEEKLTSGEIDKNIYEINGIERTLYRKTRETFLEFIKIHRNQKEMFCLAATKISLKQDSNELKQLVEKSLLNLYQNFDMLNRFLSDHDLYSKTCFEEIQKGEKGSFSFREFRLAFLLMEVANDFIQLAFKVVNNSIHLLIQLFVSLSSSKINLNSGLFSSLFEENNIIKIGRVFYKLRYDFALTLQLKESLKLLFSYLKPNSDENAHNILFEKSFNDSLLNPDVYNFEKNIVELLFVEEFGVFKTKNGFGIGTFCFTGTDRESLQKLIGENNEKSYTNFLFDIQNSIDQLLSEKNELDSLALKHESSLKSIHSGDQKSRLQITNEYNLVNSQLIYGYKLIAEHYFLHMITYFKLCLYLLLNLELKIKSENDQSIEEAHNIIQGYYNEVEKKLSEINSEHKINFDDRTLCQNKLNSFLNFTEMDKASEISAYVKLFHLNKYWQILELNKNIYTSILNILKDVKRSITQKKSQKVESKVISKNIDLVHDLQFGLLGNDKGQFNHPSYICSNQNGDIYITDSFNHRVQKFDLNGNHILNFGNFGDFKGYLHFPYGILCDQNNNLFVCDCFNNRIQKFDSDGNHILSWGILGNEREYLNNPVGICRDNENCLYVTDMGNHRVQKYTADGQYVLSIGKQGKNDGEFFQPAPICFIDDLILVGEISSDRIQLFNKKGGFIKSFNYSNGTATKLQGTSNIAVDNNGYIYISEFWNNKIYILSKEFQLVALLDQGNSFIISLNGPSGIVFTNKYMFLCNHFNHRIHRFRQ